MPAVTAVEPCHEKLLPIVSEYLAGFQGQQELSQLAVKIHLKIQVRFEIALKTWSMSYTLNINPLGQRGVGKLLSCVICLFHESQFFDSKLVNGAGTIAEWATITTAR